MDSPWAAVRSAHRRTKSTAARVARGREAPWTRAPVRTLANTSPVPFYLFAALSQFFFSGFNTAIYAIIPDCVEYSEWITGIRNDGFQYAFISLGNKVGMALGTSLLALALGMAGYESNAVQNGEVLSIMRHGFSTIPGVLWILTAGVLFFYRLDKRTYNRIVAVIRRRSGEKGNLG